MNLTALEGRAPSTRRSLRSRAGGLAVAAVVMGAVAACGSTDAVDTAGASGATGAADTAEETVAEVEVPDLTGVWESTADSDFSQRAVIAGSAITVDWVPADGSDDSRLYWAGSFEAPTAEGPYTWTSSNDHGQTGSELLASSADTKDFSYEDGEISFEASALGESGTVTLEQTSETVPAGADTSAAPAEAAGHVEVAESGMAVNDGYAWVTAMVQHEGLTGEFATVLFNVYDEEDNLIASIEQVEELSTEGTTFPMGTQVDIPSGSTAARVEASVSASDYGSRSEAMPVIDPIAAPASNPQFTIENTTGEDWVNPRIQIVCLNDAGEIVGGSSAFPSTVPAGGEILVADEYMIVGSDATTCEAYVQLSLPM